ncbi:MAG: tripartite tricarboxylate transporter TctB family protein [Desulfobacteraceae bacterium]|nr:tripartite tricarboxylate transporter TctB family protein [Desulfobacteraceae bacterium]
MGLLAYFSEGTGLALLIAGLFIALALLAVVVLRYGKREYFGQIMAPSSLIGLCIVFFAITFSFPEEEAGPRAVPRLWIFWLCVLSSMVLIQIFRRKAAKDPAPGRLGFVFLMIALLTGYYFAIQTAGYFLSTFVFLALLMHILGYKNKWIIYAVSTGWVIFSYIVFYRVLYIQLPLGYFENYF